MLEASSVISKVLIVDDDRDIVDIVRTSLEKEGLPTIGVYSGQEALEEISRSIIGMAFLDVRMPDMNGIETFKKLREINTRLPVVMMTAYDDPLLEKDAFTLGVYRYIYKPFKISQLVSIAKEVLGK
jgi:DNA-binding NtrC family response regulator